MSHSYPAAHNWELSFSQSLHSLFAQPKSQMTLSQSPIYPNNKQTNLNVFHQEADHDDDSSVSDDDHSLMYSDRMDLHHADDFRSSSSPPPAAVAVNASSPFSVPPILYSLFENLSSVSSNDSKDFRADGVYKRHAPNIVRLKNVFSTAKFYPLYANQYDSEHDIQTIVAEVPIVIIRKSDFQETTAPSFVYSTVIGSNHSLRNISRTLAEYSLLPTKCSQKLPNYQSADQCDILIVCDWKKGDKQFKSVLNKHYTPAMVRKALIIFDKEIATPKIRGKCDFRPRADIRAIYSVNENYSNEEIYAKLQQSENELQMIDARPCSACHQQKYFLCSNGDYQCIHCQRLCMANEFFPSKSSSPVPSLSSDSDECSSDDEKKIRGKKRRRSDENKPNKRPSPTIVKPAPATFTIINNDSFRLPHHRDEDHPSLDLLNNSLPSLEAFGNVSPSIESLTAPANDHLLLHDINSPFFFDPIGLSYSNSDASSIDLSSNNSIDDEFSSF